MLLALWLRMRGIADPEPFVDEGANILTALDPRVRAAFEPLAQGRPWLVYLFKPAAWFSFDQLGMARLMSAGAGLATLGALGVSLRQLAGRTAALCGLWVWAVLPLAVFHERLALADPFVTALLAWAVALIALESCRAEKHLRWPWLLSAGVFFGTAFLLKISAAFALPWIGLFYLAVQRQCSRPLFDRRLLWFALGALVPVASLGSEVLQLGSHLDRYNALPTFNGGEVGAALWARLKIWLEWYAGYGGWPLGLLLLTGVLATGFLRLRLAFLCGLGWLISLLVTGVFFHNTYARYLLPDQLPLVLFLSLAGEKLICSTHRFRLAVVALGSLALARWGVVDWPIGTEPTQAAVPAAEIVQYFTGPWSGRGINEVRRYLASYAAEHHVRCWVLTHRFYRPGCYGLMLAESSDPRLAVLPCTIYEPQDLTAARTRLRNFTRGEPVALFILYEGSLYPAHPWLDASGGPTRRVLEVPHGEGESFTLYQFEL